MGYDPEYGPVTRCPWCRRPFLAWDGPLCDCIERHCDHKWGFAFHDKRGQPVTEDGSEGEFLAARIRCERCGKEAIQYFDYAETLDLRGNVIHSREQE